MKRFPQELLDKIAFYLKYFDRIIVLSPDYAAVIITEPVLRVSDEFAITGNIIVLKWLHKHRRSLFTWKVPYFAGTFGHLEVLKWLHRIGGDFGTQTLNQAICNGHFEIVK